ncbi:MAG: autotransporter-associated beta strand repeat-containing protein [Chthoniobacteraceae bacterium]
MKAPSIESLFRSVFVRIALLLAFGSLSSTASATVYTWDSDATLGNGATEGSGTWNTTNYDWINNSGASAKFSSSSANSVVFAGVADGTYQITLGGAYSISMLTFSTSGYTLVAPTPYTLTILNITLGSGVTATIGSGVTVTRTSTAADEYVVGGGLSSELIIQTGGSVLLATSGHSLHLQGITVTVDGGTLSSTGGGTGNGTIYLADGGVGDSAVLNVENGGLVSTGMGGKLLYGSSSGTQTAVVNLDGGTIQTSAVGRAYVASNQNFIFNFNGGTLQCNSDTNASSFMGGITHAYVKEGGAKIDDGGYAITISQALEHGGTAAQDGGLTKSGIGTLTLTGTSTYTGNTTIQSGTLALNSAGSISSSTLVLGISGSAQGTFDVSSKSSYSMANISGNGTIKSGGTFTATGSLTPGFTNVAGSLNVSGNFTLAGTAVTSMEILGTGGVAGTDYDLISVTNLLTYGGALVITCSDLADGLYDFFNFASYTGDFSSVTVNGISLIETGGVWSYASGSYSYSFTESTGILSVIAVPEPATYVMLVSGLGMLGMLRRKFRA